MEIIIRQSHKFCVILNLNIVINNIKISFVELFPLISHLQLKKPSGVSGQSLRTRNYIIPRICISVLFNFLLYFQLELVKIKSMSFPEHYNFEPNLHIHTIIFYVHRFHREVTFSRIKVFINGVEVPITVKFLDATNYVRKLKVKFL